MTTTQQRIILLCASLILLNAAAEAGTIALRAGNLLDVESGALLKNRWILIEGDRIRAVSETQPDADETLDLSGAWLLPGLMDMHVHLEVQSSPTVYLERFTVNAVETAYTAIPFAERTLMAGFTTVRDLGGSGVNTALRDAVRKGYVKGPRIFSAGKSIATTGGHADPTSGYRGELMGDPGPKEGVINGPDEARKAVRQRYKNGADCIKITATGGVLSMAKSGQAPQFTMEELRAIVETARDYNMVTAAHAHGVEGMKRAVLAGIDSIEHGTLMTEEVMDLMIERGTYYVPTITAGKFVAEMATIEGYYPAIVVPKALEIGPKIMGTFAKAYRRGVKIAFGTDTGVSPHGDNAREFIYMVEAGMKPVEAIQSATLAASRLLRVDDQLGRIKPGYIADIIAVGQNPLENISILTNVTFVMKEGIVYKRHDELP